MGNWGDAEGGLMQPPLGCSREARVPPGKAMLSGALASLQKQLSLLAPPRPSTACSQLHPQRAGAVLRLGRACGASAGSGAGSTALESMPSPQGCCM